MQKQATYKVLDYDPFGFLMPSRSFTGASGYKFGFNGMEHSELEGNYTTHFRMLDTRLGRWWSIDPKFRKYPHESPYLTFHNNPIFWTDPKGDDPPEKTKTHTVGEFSKDKEQTVYSIAENNNVSVEDIMKWNPQIKDDYKIFPGDVLNVSDPNRWENAGYNDANSPLYKDNQNPEERWVKKGDDWVDINRGASTWGEYMEINSNNKVGTTNETGETTIVKVDNSAVIMMNTTEQIAPWAIRPMLGPVLKMVTVTMQNLDKKYVDKALEKTEKGKDLKSVKQIID